ncbi:hypothetical protein [Algoriphagus machipongonensis]|uniref:Uncharacterized protein n=1 Tax=Algoriphagus machipongonensis TaxID=388413 RepID=A3HRE3_9BACT|nr:hypothetical protein [Algoriphagus machipongonensis]EAZ82411.1 hypothetical protein ALPR1_09360 [Algoriphagus machipongonensis]
MSLQNSLKPYLLSMVLIILASIMVYFTNGRSLLGIDDANIYMVYMRNFSDGYGFVYNIGGDKVQGFTSLLWTLIGSLMFTISSQPEILLLILNTLIVTFALGQIIIYIQKNLTRIPENKWIYILLFFGFLLVIPGYFEWTIFSLLETGLWSALLTGFTLNILNDSKRKDLKAVDPLFAVMLVISLITRPESMLWGLFFLTAKAFLYIKSKSFTPKSFIAFGTYLLIFSIGLAIVLTWRTIYFGYPLPNTFYAKVSEDIFSNLFYGIFYLYRIFLDNPLMILIIFISIYFSYKSIIKNKIKFDFDLIFLTLILGVTLFIPIYTGGDHFTYSRFLQPTLPLIYLLLMYCLDTYGEKVSFKAAGTAIAFVSFIPNANLYENILYQTSPLAHEWGLAKGGRLEGERLNEFFNELDTLPSQGVLTAGGVAYSYRGETNDLLGLNNEEMAHADEDRDLEGPKNHSGFDKEVFYNQEPDLFFLSGGFYDESEAEYLTSLEVGDFSAEVFKNIYEDEKFKEMYSAVLIDNPNLNYSLAVFASRDFLDELKETDFIIKELSVTVDE